VPASDEEVACFDRAYCRELPNRIVPTIEILEEAFPRVAAAYRRAELANATARIGLVLDDYDDDLDAVLDEIVKRTGAFDLKLDFDKRADLDRFLQAYEASLTDCEAAQA
jgi:hypothetical protein